MNKKFSWRTIAQSKVGMHACDRFQFDLSSVACSCLGAGQVSSSIMAGAGRMVEPKFHKEEAEGLSRQAVTCVSFCRCPGLGKLDSSMVKRCSHASWVFTWAFVCRPAQVGPFYLAACWLQAELFHHPVAEPYPATRHGWHNSRQRPEPEVQQDAGSAPL